MNSEPAKLNFAGIARNLTEGITSGRYPIGSLLPTELELCSQFGTSRHTIRAALNELQQLGLVSRRKNVGTRVEAAQPTREFSPSLSSVDDLVQFGSTHIRKVMDIAEVALDREQARELGCKEGSRWLRISSLRMNSAADRVPVGWTDVYVDPACLDIAERVRQSPGVLISALIESSYGRRIAEIRQEIHAAEVPEAIAEALQVTPGSAALRIFRWYYDAAGALFEMSVSVHPAARFAVSMTLKRSERRG